MGGGSASTYCKSGLFWGLPENQVFVSAVELKGNVLLALQTGRTPPASSVLHLPTPWRQ